MFDASVPINHRADKPAELDAHPIRIPGPDGKLYFNSLAGVAKVISYADWYTIVGTSDVPELVKLAIDPSFNANPTMARRTQYLADLVGMQDGRIAVQSVLTAPNPQQDNKVISFVFIANGFSESVSINKISVKTTHTESGKLLLMSGSTSRE